MWFFCPAGADVFVGRESFEGLESSSEVVSVDEVDQVLSEVFVGLVVEAFDGSFFEGSVHALDLTVGPGVFWLRCLVPGLGGSYFSERQKEALWDKFFTDAPARQRQWVERYSIVKRA